LFLPARLPCYTPSRKPLYGEESTCHGRNYRTMKRPSSLASSNPIRTTYPRRRRALSRNSTSPPRTESGCTSSLSRIRPASSPRRSGMNWTATFGSAACSTYSVPRPVFPSRSVGNSPDVMDEELTQLVWDRAAGCCEYCRLHHDYSELTFEVDHVNSMVTVEGERPIDVLLTPSTW